MKIAALLAVTTGTLHAEDFAAPAEGPVAFRRDLVPLDVETMAELSQQLMALADGLDAKTAAARRGAAQMLALAVALDPANAKARILIGDFTNGIHTPDADAGKLEKFRSRIWQYIGWLETPEAGKQGLALAACLKDVAVISDPKDPRAEAPGAAGERGAWKGWIPPLTAYETRETAPPEETTPAEATPVAPALASARIFTPLWKANPDAAPGKWMMANAPLKMSAVINADDAGSQKPFALTIGSAENANVFKPLGAQILTLLKKQHGPLPAGVHVTLGGDELDASVLTKKRQSIGAASAVLASAAVTGREPGDVTVIGVIDPDGAFKLTTDFWNQLQALGPGTGARLILPAAAAECLPSMLALEKPQFFMEYEVLLAADFKEVLDLTAKAPGESLAKVLAQFREIHDKGASLQVREYVANPFVRRRLTDIAQQAPYHFSARMLVIQAAGNRPAFISRDVLLSELRRAIEPMEWITKRTSSTFEIKELDQIGTTYETCRGQVDRLARYADKGDREILSKVQDMVTTIRTLDRATKSRGDTYDVMQTVTLAQTALLTAYAAVTAELSPDAGDGETPPVR